MDERARLTIERTADAVLRRLGLPALARALDGSDRAHLRILTYHRVSPVSVDPAAGDPDLISATPERFAQQVDLLVRCYHPTDAETLLAAIRRGAALPPRAVLVTFDDGYRDFGTYAWPILQARGVPVILFVPTAYPDRERRFWWDELWHLIARTSARSVWVPWAGSYELQTLEHRRLALRQIRRTLRPLHPTAIEHHLAELRGELGEPPAAPRLLLGWGDLRQLAQDGVVLASHGRTHASLPALTKRELIQEIEGAQADLTREVGSAPGFFAYPFGHDDRRAATVLERLGFVAAFGVAPGRNVMPPVERFRLFRQSVNASHSLSRLELGLAGFYPQPIGAVRAALRSARGV